MADTLNHRGPDDGGIHVDGSVALGHRRLSIIDVVGGHQPMSTPDGMLSIVFNGEIFNFVELRRELEQKGHRFMSRSDTEVILHLYRQYGTECVNHMNGQWAFALYDAQRRRLFLSRDRVGVRPLFYTYARGSFIFGSEIKAVLAHPAAAAEIDLEALRQLFTFWFVVPPKTPFKNICQLPPGHSLVFENGISRVMPYWQLDFTAPIGNDDLSRSDSSYVEELVELLRDATRLRLRADVRVAAYLSGGLDSAVTSILARDLLGPSLRTFSIAFSEPELDESRYQLEMAKFIGTEHETVQCSAENIAEVLEELIWHLESPVLRTAPGPMFLLSQMVSQRGIKVVLTGEGADEFLGGYDIYKETKIRAFWAAQPQSTRRPLLLRRLYPYLSALQKQPGYWLQSFFVPDSSYISDPYFSHRPRWRTTSKLHMLFSDDVHAATKSYDPYSAIANSVPSTFSTGSNLSRAQQLEAAFLLPNYLLSSQGDRAAMAHSVEGRYPFLDHRVIEFATRLPEHLRLKVLKEKYALKQAFAGRVPRSIAERPKQPYRAPDAATLVNPATGKFRTPYIEYLLSPECLRSFNLFAAHPTQRLIAKAQAAHQLSFVDNAALVGICSAQAVAHQFVDTFQERLSRASTRRISAAVCN